MFGSEGARTTIIPHHVSYLTLGCSLSLLVQFAFFGRLAYTRTQFGLLWLTVA